MDDNNLGDLENTGEIGDITEDDLPSLNDLGAFEDITEEEMALLGDISEMELSALETSAFDDLSDLDLDDEIAELPLDNPELSAADSNDGLGIEALPSMDNGEVVMDEMPVLDLDGDEEETADFNTDIDDLMAETGLTETLPESPELHASGHIPVLPVGNGFDDVDLDINNLELELAADLSDYDEIDGLVEIEAESISDNTPEFLGQGDDLLSAEEITFDASELMESESEEMWETNETTDEATDQIIETTEAIAPDFDINVDAPKEHPPIIDTEAPEELAVAIASPSAPPTDEAAHLEAAHLSEETQDNDQGTSPKTDLTDESGNPAELSAEEILSRIENRQHYFIGFYLPNLNLTQQNLRDCVFDQSNLTAGNFQSSDVRDTSFKKCNLQDSNFQYTSLERTDFEKANLQKVDFRGMLFNERTNFRQAKLQAADFSDLDFSRPPIFTEANLHRTKFIGVNLRDLNLGQWDLTEAKLCRANLINANLREAILTDADLTGAVYSDTTIFPEHFDPEAAGALHLQEGANLAGANLQGLDLHLLDLKQVNFQGANLEHTNLNDCDLSQANLTGANLR
ncbi:MAG: pentapeptide repeat-containing protein, partial [Limnothrix sp. RL_2_0]|nr:pentapeptide repeat-containing protein [Limnothrix sp. RL_2_0]